MRLVQKILLGSALFLTQACSSNILQSPLKGVAFAEKDFSQKQSGEGLAEQLPGQPILVDHPLNMSMAFSMDGGMGVAIAVGMHKGNTKKTIEVLQSLPPIQLKARFIAALQQNEKADEWSQMLHQLLESGRKIVIRPYCKLFGYPKAVLETKVAVTMLDPEGEILWSQELKVISERRSISGEQSWSDDKLFFSEIKRAIPLVLEQLNQAVREKVISN